MRKLSKLQQDILNHRLELEDEIIEVLREEQLMGGQEPWSDDLIRKSIEGFKTGDLRGTIKKYGIVAEAVLVDAVDGSTYWAAYQSEHPERTLQLANIARAGVALCGKVYALTGTEVKFPVW